MRITLAALCILAAGCTTQPGQFSENVPSRDAPKPTLLLVALDDGTMVKQEISVDADVCMKTNGQTVTTCYREGSPIYDPRTSAIIGYRMQKTQVRLYSSQ